MQVEEIQETRIAPLIYPTPPFPFPEPISPNSSRVILAMRDFYKTWCMDIAEYNNANPMDASTHLPP